MKNILQIFLFSLSVLSLTGCNYYMVSKIEKPETEKVKEIIAQFQQKNKYFILHAQGNDYHLTNLIVDSLKSILNADYAAITGWSKLLYLPGGRSKYRYRSGAGENIILKFVYLNSDTLIIMKGKVEMPLSALRRIDEIQKDYFKSTFTWALPAFIPVSIILSTALTFTINFRWLICKRNCYEIFFFSLFTHLEISYSWKNIILWKKFSSLCSCFFPALSQRSKVQIL